MNIIKTNIDGVLIIEPRLFRDARGYFFESFSEREFEEKVSPILGHSVHFCQDNESMSSYGVMRGLHFQRPPYTQSKLVRCVKDGIPNAENKADNVVENIGSHALTKSHSRHLHIDYLRNLGLNITALEDDAELQDKVLSIHHSTMITISSTKAAKIIENQNGISFINTIG